MKLPVAMPKPNILRTIQIVLLLLLSAMSSEARIGETLVDIEKRFGPPLAQDHPIFKNQAAKALISLPQNNGIFLWIEYARASQGPGEPSAKLAEWESISKALSVRVYLFNNVLIQVVFLRLRSGIQFSYSEAMYVAEERNGQWILDAVSKPFLEQAVAKVGELKALPDYLKGIVPDRVAELATLNHQIDEADSFRGMEPGKGYDEMRKRYEGLTQRWSVLVGIAHPDIQPGNPGFSVKAERRRLEQASTRGALPIDGYRRNMGSGPSRIWMVLTQTGGKNDPMYDLLEISDMGLAGFLKNMISMLNKKAEESLKTKKSVNGF